jgi:catechol 2,3-dioxygenase-like lactoylglutathione lyase family enzyme
MISGGTASVYVSDMDRAIAFYTDAVGLRLIKRVGTTWAEIDAGEGLIIGLHPANPPQTAAAGVPGSINIELRVTVPMEEAIAALSARGVVFEGPIKEYDAVRIASFSDPDGNAIVLGQVLKS